MNTKQSLSEKNSFLSDVHPEKTLARKIIDAAFEVHKHLGGPGLIENIYESALCHELTLRAIAHQRQIPIPVIYKSSAVRDPLYLDILVDQKIIIEVKANGKDYPYYEAQLFTHLRLTKLKLGLLINFGKRSLEEGISYIINDPKSLNLKPESPR